MRISDWSSDVCSSDLLHDLARRVEPHRLRVEQRAGERSGFVALEPAAGIDQLGERSGVALRETVRAETLDLLEDLVDELRGVILLQHQRTDALAVRLHVAAVAPRGHRTPQAVRSEEHTSELQSLMRISYAVFCLKKKKTHILL